MNQIELHKKIKEFLLKDPNAVKKEELSGLIEKDNQDAWDYLFSNADENWLEWFWENGFLNKFKEKSEDPTRFGGVRIPELNYLTKVYEKDAKGVVDIMFDDSVATSKDNFNPGTMSQFLWICGKLPADQLKRMIPKIKEQNWVEQMGVFNSFGFEYEEMFETLNKAKDYENVLNLAEVVLSVRSKKEAEKDGYGGISTDKVFYFNDFSYIKVFEYLANIDDEYYKEQALALSVNALIKIANLGKNEDKSENVFSKQDMYPLYDVDLFSLKLGDKEHLSHKDNVRQLVALVKELSESTIGSFDTDPFKAKEFYDKYFASLPDSQSMWKLRLYVMSLYPEYFKEELKKEFFRLFDVIDKEISYYDILSGAEYEKTLQRGFLICLSPEEQKDYLKKVVGYFKKLDDNKKNENENWHKKYGSRILTVLKEYIEKDDDLKKIMENARKEGFEYIEKYKPEPSIKFDGYVRAIVPQSPFSEEELEKKEVSEIAENLKDKWSPEKLKEDYGSLSDYHHPINAEGLGANLKKDISKRLQDYVNNSESFFDREKLDPHYTYFFLRGIEETIKNDREGTKKIKWDNLINFCVSVSESGRNKPFEKRVKEESGFDDWLAGWEAVHTGIVDVLQKLFDGEPVVDFAKYREKLLPILDYLLTNSDPVPEDERLKTAKIQIGGYKEDRLVGDPFSIAINSVRGRAFQLLVIFVYKDGDKLSDEIKNIYKNLLERENTRAIMFMFGHYFATFYFRDEKWIKEVILPIIYNKEDQDEYLYLAFWEGLLANNLYGKMFFDSAIQKMYEKGIDLKDTKYKNQKHFREVDEGLATHFALAYMFFNDKFGLKHPLFVKFWNKDIKKRVNFTKFVGSMFIAGRNQDADELIKQSKGKKTLKDLWDYILNNCDDKEVFEKMGMWVSLKKDIFESKELAEKVRKTLEKSNGYLDWEIGLNEVIEELAKESPENTLEIAKLYLSDIAKSGRQKSPFRIEVGWFDAIKILYENKKTKEETITLIDELIKTGGHRFWELEKIINI